MTGNEDKVWDEEAIRNARVYNVLDQSNNRQANAWPNPADHFSILRTFMGAASYVAGAHSFRGGVNWSTGDWRLLTMWTGDVQPITYNAGRAGVGDVAPAVGSQQRHRPRPRLLPAGQAGRWAASR